MKVLKIILTFAIFGSLECENNLESPIVFYDLNNKMPLGPPITTVIPYSEGSNINMSSIVNVRLPFIGQPCEFLINNYLL